MGNTLICENCQNIDAYIKNKHIILFGASIHSKLLFLKYGNKIKLDCVVDNDKRKQGLLLENILGDCGNNGKLIVKSPQDIVGLYDSQMVVILVASVHFLDIKEQLHNIGYNNVVSLLEIYKQENYDDIRQIFTDSYSELPLNRKKIVMIMSFYGGHEKYITYELNKWSEIEIVWCIKNRRNDVPLNIKCVNEANYDEYLKELETAHIIIYDNALPKDYKKRKDQIVVFVKHWGSITLKKFFLEDKTSCAVAGNVERMKNQIQMIDYIFSGSEFDENSLKSGMNYEGKYIRVGSPRSDALFSKEIRQRVFDDFKIPTSDKILLYAPTFRKDKNENNKEFVVKNKRLDIDFDEIRSVLEKKYQVKWHIMVKLHPMAAVQSEHDNYGENIIDVSLYDDAQELMSAADILITDYSSLMFEPAIVGKTVFLYAPDKSEYVNKERDLLIDYDSLPFDISQSNDELIKQILTFDENLYKKKVKKFLDSYGVHEDGHASERAAQFILKLIEQKELNYE